MIVSSRLWLAPILTGALALALTGCCEDEMQTDGPADKAVDKAADKNANQGGDQGAEPAADADGQDAGEEGADDTAPENPDDPPRDRFTRTEETSKKYKEIIKLQEGWEMDYINMAEGVDLVVAAEISAKGAFPSFKAALVSGDQVTSESVDFKEFMGADQATLEKLKVCKVWFGTPNSVVDLGASRKAVKVSFWCSHTEDFQAPPVSTEMVTLFELDKEAKEIKDLKRLWSGIGGSTRPAYEQCVLNTNATFSSSSPGVLERTTTTRGELFNAAPPDPTIPPDEDPNRVKCRDSAPKEPVVDTFTLP